MSATALLDQVTKLAGTVKELGDHAVKSDKVLSGLFKALEAPASKAGLSPEAFLARMTDNGNVPMTLDPNGHAMVHGRRYNDRKGIGMGPMLRALAKRSRPELNISTEEAERTFKELNIQTYQGESKAALAENSGVTGGYTVPPGFSNQLLTLAIEQSVVRPRASIMPMTTKTLAVPSLDYTSTGAAGQSPYTGGVVASWVAESATRPETEPKFRQTELTAWELSFYTVASNNILQDNAVSLDAVLTNLFSAAIAWYTDYAYLRGTGVGQPFGIQNAPATIKVTRSGGANGATFSFLDVGAMMSRFFLRADRASCAWVIHQSQISNLFTMLTGSSGQHPIFIPFSGGVQDGVNGWPGKDVFGMLAGLPVVISEKVPALSSDGDVGLYDFSKYLLGDRMDLQIEVSPHYLFVNNQMVWRVVWRGDGTPWLNNPITQADGSSSYTVSPFVILH